MLEINGDVYCLGDPHGEWEVTATKIVDLGKENYSLIILGDSGLGWGGHESGQELSVLQEIANEFNVTVYFIRGNHDNPLVWKSEVWRSNLHNKFPNLNVLPEQVISINGHHTLILGGSISVDRFDRYINVSWWPDETLYIPELTDEELSTVDTILSHTCFIPDKSVTNRAVYSFALYDKKLLNDLKEEQRQYKDVVRRIVNLNNNSDLIRIIHGHFHVHMHDEMKFTDSSKTLDITCLAIQELKKLEF